MSRTFSIKFVCSACSTPVYKVTKNVNTEKKWCSPCSQGKTVVTKQNIESYQTTVEKPHVDFNPVLAAEKDIRYYLRLLHRVEELLMENYKTPERCHFTQLWDQAKEEIE